MTHRLTLALLLALAAPVAAGTGAWLPDAPAPAALPVAASVVTTAIRELIENGTPDEPKFLQTQAFVTEGLQRERTDPPDRALAIQFLAGEFEEARVALSVPQSGAATAPRAALYRAHLEFVAQRYDEAATAYAELAESNLPEAPLARLMVGVSNLRQYGSQSGALADLAAVRASRLAAGQPLGPEELLDLIWAEHLLGQDEQAERTVQGVSGPLLADPRLYAIYAEVLVQRGDLAKARRAYGTAIAKGARPVELAQKYASLAVAGKDAPAAAGALAAAEAIAPVAGTPAVRDPWYERTADDILAAAPADLRSFRIEQAERALKDVPGPLQARAQAYLADILMLRGSPGPAADIYRDALADDPLHLTTRVKASAALLLAGRAPEAFDQFLELVDLSTVPSAERELGALRVRYPQLFSALGDAFATYLYDAQARLDKNPDDAASRRVTAAVFHALLFPDRALRALVVGGRPPAQDPQARRLWAMANWRDARQARRGLPEPELREMTAALEAELARAPSPGVEYTLAQVLKLRNERAAERAHLQHLVDTGHDAPSVVFDLATVAEAARDFARVRDLLDRLFRRDYESRTAAVARHRYVRALSFLGEAKRK